MFYLTPRLSSAWANDSFVVIALLGIIAALLLLLPTLILIARTLTAPLAKLDLSMQRFAAGDCSVRINSCRNDEIGRLCHTFNAMVEENRFLTDRAYILQLREREAELNLFQAQINPHFLYNLIHMIQWKALRRGENDLAQLAYSMGQIFRISLNRGKPMIRVSREQELITYYLNIQKERLGERITYQLTFDEATLHCMIPKLIIQPLVENAVVHGVEQSEQPVHVDVCCRFADTNHLCITVKDNGPGISPETLALLPNHLPESRDGSSGSRFALKNIYDRLTLMYGDEFFMEIQSERDCWTEIRMRLPATYEPDTLTSRE